MPCPLSINNAGTSPEQNRPRSEDLHMLGHAHWSPATAAGTDSSLGLVARVDGEVFHPEDVLEEAMKAENIRVR